MREELETVVENYLRIPKKGFDDDLSFAAFSVALEKLALRNKGSYAYTRKVHEIINIYGVAVSTDKATFLHLAEGKYRPLNAKKIREALKTKKSPIKFRKYTWHKSWMTSQGKLHYMVRDGFIVAFTTHALERFLERFHGETLNLDSNIVTSHLTHVVARMDAAGWAVPTRTPDGPVLLTHLGAFLGHQEVLDRPEAGLAAGTRIVFCKTYISMGMLRQKQVEEGWEEIGQVLSEWEAAVPRILELKNVCDL